MKLGKIGDSWEWVLYESILFFAGYGSAGTVIPRQFNGSLTLSAPYWTQNIWFQFIPTILEALNYNFAFTEISFTNTLLSNKSE